MGKSVIAAGAVVLAAAVTVTVWLLTRSDGQRGSFTYYDQNREFATPRGAVIAICHADPANTPWDPERASGLRYVQYDVHVQGGVPLIWKPLDDAQPRGAILRATDTGKFALATCDAHIAAPHS